MHRDIDFAWQQMRRDMAAKGWTDADLARRARVAASTVGRFWAGRRTNPVAKKLTVALGRPAGYYLLPDQPPEGAQP